MTSTTRTVHRRRALGILVTIAVAAAPLPFRGGDALGYDCNVHAVRQIGSQSESFREHCAAANPALGDWPICVCDNTQAISSDPNASSCAAGYTEVGRCVPSESYYQTCDTCSGATCQSGTCEGGCGPAGIYCPAVFHGFVPSPEQCGAAAHDVGSAVEGCRTLCDTLLSGRYFDQGDQSQSNNGSWRLGTSSIPDLGSFVVASGKTGVEECVDKCAPPNPDDPSPPFGADHDNHWRFVSFGRWNPNAELDGWLRSYTVNKDKPDAPKGTCEALVNDYCNDASVTSAPNVAAKRTQCKKNLLLWLQLLPSSYAQPVDFVAPTSFDLSANTSPPDLDNDGFCDLFYRGNYLANGTCYKPGDGQVNQQHKCSNEGGILSGGSCDDLTATCAGGTIDDFETATIASPIKSTACGSATVVTGGSALIAAAYSGAGADVVSATWRNETNGSSGALIPTYYGWLSATADRQSLVNAPLVTGVTNRLAVRFVDSQLRVSGDTVLVDAQ